MNKDFFKLAIIGYPLSHSISPQLQSTFLKSSGLQGSYEKFEIKSKDELKKTLDFFIGNQFNGFNVTIPYKIDIMQYLDEIDTTALKIGAVNTVKIFENGKTKGFNTDIYGFKYGILSDNNLPKSFHNAVLLGCGGAALAVVFALEELSCQNLTICARNLNKAEKFVTSLENKLNMNINIKELNSLTNLGETDIIVNATPLGTLGENENKTAISVDIVKTASEKILVYDLVYNPKETLLLKEVKKCGLKGINGMDMLIYQGIKAFEIWTGHTVSLSSLKQII